jgi:hypothetical protein
MKFLFSAEGVRNLRAAWLLLAASIAAAAGLVFGSHWYLDREKRESASGAQRLQEARSRLDRVRRERDSLSDSADTYRTLVERGMLQGEHRLDLIELVNTLRARHQLFTFDYEVGVQRQLQLPGGRAYGAIDVLASRVKLHMRALHEGDVVDFIDELSQSHAGFYPLDRCTLRRVDPAGADTLQPRVEAECAFEWVTLKDKNANRPA